MKTTALAAAAIVTLGLTACGTTTSAGSGSQNTPIPTVTVTATFAADQGTTAGASSTSAAPSTAEGSSGTTATKATSDSKPAAATKAAQPNLVTHVISYQGMDGLKVGATAAALQKADLVEPSQACEKSWDVVNGVGDYALLFNAGSQRLEGVWSKQRDVHTAEGIRMGATFAEVQRVYGKGYLVLPVQAEENLKVKVAQITNGERSILFGATDSAGEWVDVAPTSTVSWMASLPYLAAPNFGC